MRTTLATLQEMSRSNDKFTVLTCYDATFAHILEQAGIDALLIGDSLGNVLHGDATTLAVTVDDIVYHTHCVAHGASKAFIMADMPFGSYQSSPEQAYANAVRIMAAGAHMVKIEGGQIMAETVAFLTQRSIPVCAHIGLTPQSIHQLGGYRVQGNTERSAEQLLADAKTLETAGAGLLVLELVPAKLASAITQSISIPTIGIGAGAGCSAQVLVLHDLLGLFRGKKPRFVKDFMAGSGSIRQAVENFVQAVKTNQFPDQEHEF